MFYRIALYFLARAEGREMRREKRWKRGKEDLWLVATNGDGKGAVIVEE